MTWRIALSDPPYDAQYQHERHILRRCPVNPTFTYIAATIHSFHRPYYKAFWWTCTCCQDAPDVHATVRWHPFAKRNRHVLPTPR